MTLSDLRMILMQAGIPAEHYKARLIQFPYIIYKETAFSYDYAGGREWRKVTRVSVDHFTKTEFDPTLELLERVLLKNKIGFTGVVVWYEADEIVHTNIELSIAEDLTI